MIKVQITVEAKQHARRRQLRDFQDKYTKDVVRDTMLRKCICTIDNYEPGEPGSLIDIYDF